MNERLKPDNERQVIGNNRLHEEQKNDEDSPLFDDKLFHLHVYSAYCLAHFMVVPGMIILPAAMFSELS